MKLWGQGHRGPIAAKFIPISDGKRYAELEAVVGLFFWGSAIESQYSRIPIFLILLLLQDFSFLKYRL